MKKFIILTTFIALVFSLCAGVCFANVNDTYYYVKGDPVIGATMELTDGSGGKIIVPGTWYVKFISDHSSDPSKRIVEYNGIRGAISKSALSTKPTNEPKGDFYFNFNGTVNAVSRLAPPVMIYDNLTAFASNKVKNNAEVTFLAYAVFDTGEVVDNSSYVYVRTTTDKDTVVTGFMAKSDLVSSQSIIVTASANSQDPDLDTGDDLIPPTNPDNKNVPESGKVLKIILISAVCILSVVVVFLIFKPTKPHKSKRDDYYDND